jgi:hypothetical protein
MFHLNLLMRVLALEQQHTLHREFTKISNMDVLYVRPVAHV